MLTKRQRKRERKWGWGGEQLQHCQSLIKEKTVLPNVGNGTALRENGCEEGGRGQKRMAMALLGGGKGGAVALSITHQWKKSC